MLRILIAHFEFFGGPPPEKIRTARFVDMALYSQHDRPLRAVRRRSPVSSSPFNWPPIHTGRKPRPGTRPAGPILLLLKARASKLRCDDHENRRSLAAECFCRRTYYNVDKKNRGAGSC